jgi:PKD repeat protein
MKTTDTKRSWVVRTAILILLAVMLLLPLAGALDTRASPVANFSVSPTSKVVGQNVTFDASSSYGSTSLNYSWDFGDGTKGTGKVVRHVYADPGYYMVYLAVTDGSGGSDLAGKSIYISDSNDIGPTVLWGFLALYGVCLIFEIILLIIIFVIWVLNIIFLIVHFMKMNRMTMELGSPSELGTYKIVLLVIGIIGIVLSSFVLFALIAQFVVFYLFKGKAEEIRKRGRPPGPGQYPPQGYAGPPPAMGQPPQKR